MADLLQVSSNIEEKVEAVNPKPTLSICLLLAALAGAAGLSPTPVWAVQANGITEQICGRETARRERAARIPRHLLGAISLAETGRWDEAKGESFAWPWTVTARGKGRYFPSKQKAIDYVRGLKAQGVSNIDVGCMQINLFYHGDNFLSLEEALDPVRNIAFAAQFLKSHFANTRSWAVAAALYHSSTPEFQEPYKRKVLRLWNQERRMARWKTPGKDEASPGPATVPRRGTVRTFLAPRPSAQTANLTLRPEPAATTANRLEARVRSQLDQGARRLRQMDNWRNAKIKRTKVTQSTHLKRAEANLRRARKSLNDRFRSRAESEAEARFASNRRAQLEAWRRNRAARSGAS